MTKPRKAIKAKAICKAQNLSPKRMVKALQSIGKKKVKFK